MVTRLLPPEVPTLPQALCIVVYVDNNLDELYCWTNKTMDHISCIQALSAQELNLPPYHAI